MGNENHSKFTVNITPGSFLKGFFIILLFWFLFVIKDLVLVVLVAIILASGIEPIIVWFNKYKISRLPAAIISFVGFFGIFAGLIFFFVPSVLNETSDFLNKLPKYLDSATLWNPLNIDSGKVTESQKVVQGLSDGINNSAQFVKDSSLNNTSGISDLVKNIQEITSNVTGGFLNIVSTVFGGLLSFILIIVLSFYLTVQEDGVGKFLGIITPIRHEKYVIDLWKRSQKKIGHWMQGQLLLAIIVAVLVYLGLMILGIKNALLLAVFAGLLEVIPVFGPVISAIPAILSAFLDGGITSTLLVVGLYVIIQQFENHLIYPLVVKKVVGVSPIIVILALIIGAKLAGFLGIVLAVPVVSALMEFVEDIEKKKIVFLQKNQETAN
ncbi:MAG: AI-2E family transporter [Candidatus Taylorbacteria bacterium]|nr:AI-2E family transporter [Candidatus Taylorbacteria bacterium]